MRISEVLFGTRQPVDEPAFPSEGWDSVSIEARNNGKDLVKINKAYAFPHLSISTYLPDKTFPPSEQYLEAWKYAKDIKLPCIKDSTAGLLIGYDVPIGYWVLE
ncbi:unnamed protein product [Trichobilharzia regenti]|nr:unnamed protein product [Trichobilharzia regenti]